jgi:hypothetical protein
MLRFELVEPRSLQEACSILAGDLDAKPVAGGTKTVINLKKIKNMRFERLSNSSIGTFIYECGSQHLLPQDFSQGVDAAYQHAGVPRPKT